MGWEKHSEPVEPAKEFIMRKLKLSFYKDTFLHEPTKEEIFELQGLVSSASAIIETLRVYGSESRDGEAGLICTGVCRALGLLLEPVEEYFSEWGGDEAPKEPGATENV